MDQGCKRSAGIDSLSGRFAAHRVNLPQGENLDGKQQGEGNARMKKLIPTKDLNIVIRLRRDAKSIAQQAYEQAWLKATAQGRPLPEPPRIPPGPVIRTDIITLHIPCQ